MEKQHPCQLYPNFKKQPINTLMLHLTVGETSREEEKIGAFFSIEESKLHIDALQIKAVIFGLGTLCKKY